MFDKLEEVEALYERLGGELSDPNVVSDSRRFQQIAKQHAELQSLVTLFREYKDLQKQIAESRVMLKDPDHDVRELAQAELEELTAKEPAIESALKRMLRPKDPNDDRDVFVEVRAGTGGEEAALFANELLRMYIRYAERRGWKPEVVSIQETGIGGLKEGVLNIHGQGAYSHLKWEGGPHRVQRVPATESGGRIHTSVATVAVTGRDRRSPLRRLRSRVPVSWSGTLPPLMWRSSARYFSSK